MSRREQDRSEDDGFNRDGQSPLKSRRSEGGSGVTIEQLQRLLGETQNAIMQHQKDILRDELGRLEAKNEDRFSAIDKTLENHERKFETLTKSIQDLQRRQGDHDASSSTTASATSRSEDRQTVVVGGWPRDTRRQQILSKLSSVISDLDLTNLLDRDAFVTGARRSFALIPFSQRRHESKEDCRERMHSVIGRIMRAKITLPSQDRPIWAAVSKPPAERARAQHCSLVRNLVKFFSPTKVEDLECEYGRGIVWLGDHQLSDATMPCSVTDANLWRDETRDNKPWINVGAISAEIQADQEEILDFLRKQKENR